MREINGDGVSLPLGIGLYRCRAHSHEPPCVGGLLATGPSDSQEGHIKGMKMLRGWKDRREGTNGSHHHWGTVSAFVFSVGGLVTALAGLHVFLV